MKEGGGDVGDGGCRGHRVKSKRWQPHQGTRATPSGAELLSARGLKARVLNRQEEGGWKAAEI